MVYTDGDKIILFGGENAGTFNNETWEYDTISNSWTQITTIGVPSARSTYTMVYTENNKIILFGGVKAGSGSIIYDEETWEYK